MGVTRDRVLEELRQRLADDPMAAGEERSACLPPAELERAPISGPLSTTTGAALRPSAATKTSPSAATKTSPSAATKTSPSAATKTSPSAATTPVNVGQTRIEHPEPPSGALIRVRRVAEAPHASDLPTRSAHDVASATAGEQAEPEPRGVEVTREHEGRYVYTSLGDAESAELGRGGMGCVLLATDRHIGREVAIKQLLPETVEADEPYRFDAEERFVREARICGQLEHPNIVPVYELGRRDDGRLYYTMKVIRGRTLESAIGRARTLAERLALLGHFSGLCQAIAFAHSQGVVHRDIKPENVMIGEFGETVVLDWGGAKVQGERESRIGAKLAELELNPRCTAAGTWVGTPLYMSPEQALGEVDEIDERSDVWSLGVVLYQLLTGAPPFDAKTMDELVPKIVDEAHPTLASVAPEVPPALGAIVERALKKDAHERYPSARSMWVEIEAFRSGELVESYAYSSWELLARFFSRNRSTVGVALIGLFALLVTAIASYQRITDSRDQALDAERRAVENERNARSNLADVFAMQATVASDQADPIAAAVFAGQALDLEERPDARGIALGTANRTRWAPQPPLAQGCEKAAMARDARRWVCATAELSLFDGDQRTVLERPNEPISDLRLSANGSRLLVQSPLHIELWELEARTATRYELGNAQVTALAIDETGDHWATGTHDGQVLLYRGQQRRLALHWQQPISQLSLTGQRLLIGGRYGQLQSVAYQVDGTPTLNLQGHTGTITALSLSPDARYLASGSADRTVRLWPMSKLAGELTASRNIAKDMATALAFTADGRHLAHAAPDYSIRVYDLRARRSWLKLRAHDTPIDALRFSSDGRLFSSSSDLPLLPWARLDTGVHSELVDAGNVLALAPLPNSRGTFTAGVSKSGICWWSFDDTECRTRLPVSADAVRSMAVSADGRSLAVVGAGGFAVLWDIGSKLPAALLSGHTDDVRSVEFSADGRRVLTASLDGSVREWEAPNGRALRQLSQTHGAYVARYAQGGGEIAVGLRDGAVTFYDTASKLIRRIEAHTDWVMDLTFVSGRDSYVTAGADRRLALWSRSDHTLKAQATQFSGRVLSVASSLDGKWIAAASEEPVVRIFDRNLELVAELRDHWATVRVVRFTPDSRFLISAGDDRRARVWPLRALQARGQHIASSALREQRLTLKGNQLVHEAGGP